MATTNYQQLVLFDCDGGRCELFKDKTLVWRIPSNTHFYLFWNNNDKNISERLKYCEKIKQIRLHPTILCNGKNAADASLIYILGKLVDQYAFITIVHGGDQIYLEVIAKIKQEYGDGKIKDKLILKPNPEQLLRLIKEVYDRNEKNKYIDPIHPEFDLKRIVGEAVIDKSTKQCLLCNKKCREMDHLYQHVKDKHQIIIEIICQCQERFRNLKEFNKHKKQVSIRIAHTQGIIRCLATSEPARIYLHPYPLLLELKPGQTNKCLFYCCSQKPKFYSEKLLEHLFQCHNDTIDVKIRCCHDDEEYSLADFRKHIGSQHVIEDIRGKKN